ncbi:hypothetical protein ACFS07_29520 [Undibacterium arcticum]
MVCPTPSTLNCKDSFSESEISFLTAAVGAINVWNRIAGALRFALPTIAEPAVPGASH